MPVIQVNVAGDRIAALAETRARVQSRVSQHPAAAPIVVMIHGYKFSPSLAEANPHTHILSLNPRPVGYKAVSWPRGLGAGDGPMPPLCIALGWEGRTSPWAAYQNAAHAGRALAQLIGLIRQVRPGQAVDLLTHSFGARVALQALPYLPARAVGRAILMAPAELRRRAQTALNTPAGRAAEVITVTSRENDLFDSLLEWCVAPHCLGDRALSHGAPLRPTRWTNIQIDDPRTLEALNGFGLPIATPDRRICHWSVYVRPGLFPLYRAILGGALALPDLRAALPKSPSRRWSRLAQPPALPAFFPTGQA